jgi:hypothetical protein
MAIYKDIVREIEDVLSPWTKQDSYTMDELPEIIAYLLEESDELANKLGILYDIMTDNYETVS